MRCIGPTKSGRHCPRVVPDGGNGLCLFHDPGRKEEASADASARGKISRAKQTARHAAGIADKVGKVRLGTPAEIRKFLEARARELIGYDGDAKERANASARLAQAALATFKAERIEQRMEQLEAAVIERWPELKSKLRLVK